MFVCVCVCVGGGGGGGVYRCVGVWVGVVDVESDVDCM